MDPLGQIQGEHARCAGIGPYAEKKHPHRLAWGKSRGWALHLRRELAQLDQTIAQTQRLYPQIDRRADYSSSAKTWTFSSGYRVQFGHCKDSDDHERYLSNEFTAIYPDELVTFEKRQIDGVRSRLRTSDPVLRNMLRCVAMSNPGQSPGADPHWVRRTFVDPAHRGRKLLVRKMKRRDGTPFEESRIYIPGRLEDNPDRDFANAYEETLLVLPENLRRAYLDGDWYFTQGSFFGGAWDPAVHVISPFRIPSDWAIFRSMDWGYRSPGCVGWWALDHDENLYLFHELWFQEMHDADVAARIRQIETRFGLWAKDSSLLSGPADTQIWEERGNSAKSIVDVFAENGVRWEQADKSDGSRAAHAQRLMKRLRSHRGRTRLPGIMVFEHCTRTTTAIPGIQTDKLNPEKPEKGGMDHAYDMCLGPETPVLTPDGYVRLDSLRFGDEVISTDGKPHRCSGYFLTRESAKRYLVRFDGEQDFVATGDHRILCATGEWKRVDHLDKNDYGFRPWNPLSSPERAKNLAESDITEAADTIETPTNRTAAVGTCIATFTEPTKARFRQGTTCTTSTTTVTTTGRKTSRRCRAVSTSDFTAAGHARERSFTDRKKLGHGTQAKRAGIGTEPARSSINSAEFRAVLRNVSVAEEGSKTGRNAESANTAPTHAQQRPAERPDLTTSSVFALPAESRSWPTGSRMSNLAHGSAVAFVRALEIEPGDVGCIEVPGMGAFVAAGVVVSNCAYACAYATRGRASIGAVDRASAVREEWGPPPREDNRSSGRWGYGTAY